MISVRNHGSSLVLKEGTHMSYHHGFPNLLRGLYLASFLWLLLLAVLMWKAYSVPILSPTEKGSIILVLVLLLATLGSALYVRKKK